MVIEGVNNESIMGISNSIIVILKLENLRIQNKVK